MPRVQNSVVKKPENVKLLQKWSLNLPENVGSAAVLQLCVEGDSQPHVCPVGL